MTRKFQKIVSGMVLVAFFVNKFFNFGLVYTPSSFQIDMFITTIIFFLFGNIFFSAKDKNSNFISFDFGNRMKNSIAFIALSLQTILMIYNFNMGNHITDSLACLSMLAVLTVDILK
jgi:hypothetical protein